MSVDATSPPTFDITPPYLLFYGDADTAKTARGICFWRPQSCTGQCRYPGNALDLGLADMSPQ